MKKLKKLMSGLAMGILVLGSGTAAIVALDMNAAQAGGPKDGDGEYSTSTFTTDEGVDIVITVKNSDGSWRVTKDGKLVVSQDADGNLNVPPEE